MPRNRKPNLYVLLIGTFFIAMWLGSLTCRAPSDQAASISKQNPQHCPTEGLASNPSQRAVACAQAFVIAQGYTGRAASVDSTSTVYELIEVERTWLGVLRSRSGQLDSLPVVVCADSLSYFVAFRQPADTMNQYGRAVRVPRDWEGIHMVHQVVGLQAFKKGVAGCEVLRNF
jgi:hypothetical protein